MPPLPVALVLGFSPLFVKCHYALIILLGKCVGESVDLDVWVLFRGPTFHLPILYISKIILCHISAKCVYNPVIEKDERESLIMPTDYVGTRIPVGPICYIFCAYKLSFGHTARWTIIVGSELGVYYEIYLRKVFDFVLIIRFIIYYTTAKQCNGQGGRKQRNSFHINFALFVLYIVIK